MNSLLEDDIISTPGLSQACAKVYNACEICVSSGNPSIRKKVSLTHVNTAFNEETQADFVIVYIRGIKKEVMNIVDMGTNNGERKIAPSRNAQNMMQIFETEWLMRHVAPKQFSADPEFCRTLFKELLRGHGIQLNARLSRSCHKNGKVERNNGVFKTVLEKISKENTDASDELLIARESLLTNLLHGNSGVSAFQLTRGYSPSIVGLPASVVSQEMIDAHTEVCANRALHRVLKSRSPKLVRSAMLKKGTRIWVFHNTSSQNIPKTWVEATVIDTSPHYVKCRRSQRGRPMTVAYEHVRIAPNNKLARELLENSLEEQIALPDNSANIDNRNNENMLEEIFGSDCDDEEEIDPIGTEQSLMTVIVQGNPELEIGNTPYIPNNERQLELQSSEQVVQL